MLSSVWPGDAPITQPFGCTPLTVEPWWALPDCHWHCGVDIGLNVGTPLLAARAGTVTTVAYGLLAITTASGQVDWYVHIDRAIVAVGQAVPAGQLVAFSGAKVPSGGTLTGPHLHFEVQTGHLNNPATSHDPIPLLSGLAGGGGGPIGGNDVTSSEARGWVILAYRSSFDRNPSLAEISLWQQQVNLDGSNVDIILAGILNSPEAVAHAAKIGALIAAGPSGPGPQGAPGPAGPAGPQGPPGTVAPHDHVIPANTTEPS